MQHEVIKPQELLNPKGFIQEEGWSRKPVWEYSRAAVKAPWYRIKEWDYYYILAQEQQLGVTVTVSDLGYAGLMAVCYLDFGAGWSAQIDTIVPFTRGKLGLGAKPGSGKVHYQDKKLAITIDPEGPRHFISVDVPGLQTPEGLLNLQAEIYLSSDPDADSLNIATSWKENRKAFYLNHKTTCMPADGYIQLGERNSPLSPETALGGLDWGRGRWTYKNRWYWSSLSTRINQDLFGMNLGYGFSDRSPASENALFFNGTAHKLKEVTFDIPRESYMKPWKITDSEGRLTVTMKPLLDRSSKTHLGIIVSDQHQVFGLFSGKAVLDDGREIVLDNTLGFAEDVLNYW